MPSIIESLPGVTLPISKISETLSGMWLIDTTPNLDAPSEFRASQMNLILHIGRETPIEEAILCFHTAIIFSQRYPCRIIVLCPGEEVKTDDSPLEGKLFTQCFIGEGLREMCCCEAIIIGYDITHKDYLENQISVWLENDLPTYYWFNRVPEERINNRYLDFAKDCTRIVYDSAIEGHNFDNVQWPDPTKCHDLTYSRILPLRQSIAQVMSSISPELICNDLNIVKINYSDHLRCEAHSLMNWIKCCLSDCNTKSKDSPEFEFQSKEKSDSEDFALLMEFQYKNDKTLEWSLDHSETRSFIKNNIGGEDLDTTMRVNMLNLEKALAEALFFN